MKIDYWEVFPCESCKFKMYLVALGYCPYSWVRRDPTENSLTLRAQDPTNQFEDFEFNITCRALEPEKNWPDNIENLT